jgi:hypothetical protein
VWPELRLRLLLGLGLRLGLALGLGLRNLAERTACRTWQVG